MTGQPRSVGGLSGLLPSAAKYDFDLRLVRDGKEWKLASAGWQPVRGLTRDRGLTPRPNVLILPGPLCSSVAQWQSIRLLTGGL